MLKAPALERGRFVRTIKRAALAVGLLSLVGSAAAQIVPSVVASRLSGVAPLFVFFDATGTTDPTTARPFHDLEYRWDFRDLGSGYWSTTGLQKNFAKGPVTGHVFETPGTYTVNYFVRNAAGSTPVQYVQQINVQDPNVVFSGSNTLCVGNSLPVAGSDGCPAGAAVLASSSFNGAIDFACLVSTCTNSIKRILFRRGDTFTSSIDSEIQVDGPGVIGAFGTGTAPVVNATANVTIISLSSRDTPTIKDWRIMDLEINGNSWPESNGIFAQGGIDQVTLLRVNIHHVHSGVQLSPDFLTFHDPSGTTHKLWDQWAVVDSTVRNAIGGDGGYLLYFAGQRTALMGNVLSDSGPAAHVLRTPYIFKGVFSHNDMSRPAADTHVVKMQSTSFLEPFPAAPTPYTEQIFFSDNKFTSGDGAGMTVTLGPMNAESDERVKHVILERNWFAPHPGQDVALTIWAQDVTVRNNIFNLTGGLGQNGIIVEQRGIEPPAANVHVYNNTFYGGSSGGFQAMWFRFNAGPGHIVRNTLAYAPLASPAVVIQDDTSGAVTASHNTGDPGIPDISTWPSFGSASPVVPVDFRLLFDSYALDIGTAAPVYTDYFGSPRPLGTQYSLGFGE